jgi:hypothetical protein
MFKIVDTLPEAGGLSSNTNVVYIKVLDGGRGESLVPSSVRIHAKASLNQYFISLHDSIYYRNARDGSRHHHNKYHLRDNTEFGVHRRGAPARQDRLVERLSESRALPQPPNGATNSILRDGRNH